MKRNSLMFCFLFGVFIGFTQEVTTPDPQAVPEMNSQDSYEESWIEENPSEYETIEAPAYNQQSLNPKFKDQYKGEIYDYDRVVEEKKESPKEIEIKEPLFSFPTGGFQVLIYFAIGALILVILFLILRNSDGSVFSPKKIKITSVALEEEELENFEQINFALFIEKEKANQNYRKAIRYYYLWTLQMLADKKQIVWHRDKTDTEYLNELNGQQIYNDFSSLLYIYDYVWYGQYPLNELDFTKGETHFKTTMNKI